MKATFSINKTRNLKFVVCGPDTWNMLPGNLKSATSVISFRHYIKEYFLKKLLDVKADIYSYT